MTDIVERLRQRARFDTCVAPEKLMLEAADEIERLRAALEKCAAVLNNSRIIETTDGGRVPLTHDGSSFSRPQSHERRDMSYFVFGPIRILKSKKNLAPWGFPRVCIGGLNIWSWWNDGSFAPLSYHPRSSITWLWQTKVHRGKRGPSFRHNCGGSKDFWLPLGWVLTVMWQNRMTRGET